MWIHRLQNTTPVVVMGHGGVGSAAIQLLLANSQYQVVGVIWSNGSRTFQDNQALHGFINLEKKERGGTFEKWRTLNDLLEELEKSGLKPIIVDAGSHSDIDDHPNLLKRWFQIVTARKDPLAYSKSSVAHTMLRSKNYRAETTIMANEWVLDRIMSERLDGNSTCPIWSIQKIELISSWTLAAHVKNQINWTPSSESARELIKNGDTEPDPTLDFCGIDFGKKLIEAARAAGYSVDFADIVFGAGFLSLDYRELYNGVDMGNDEARKSAHTALIGRIQQNEDERMKGYFAQVPAWMVPRYVGTIVPVGKWWVSITAELKLVPKDSKLWKAELNIALITIDNGEGSINPVVIEWKWSWYRKTAVWLIREMNTLSRPS